jgi:hypothetical protein
MRWNAGGERRRPKILYLADRNILVDDPKDNRFLPFGDARHKIEGGRVVKSRDMYFAIYQAIAKDEARPRLGKGSQRLRALRIVSQGFPMPGLTTERTVFLPRNLPPTPKTTAARLRSIVKSARDVMRKDKGLSGDLDRLPMLTWIMFLKFLDDMENIRTVEATLAGEVYHPVIAPPYRWRDWASAEDGISGDDLRAFINQDESTLPDGSRGPGCSSTCAPCRAATAAAARRSSPPSSAASATAWRAATCCATWST